MRAALTEKLVKQSAKDFRHDRHGEVLLALSRDELETLFAVGEPMRNKACALARDLALRGRLAEAFGIYEAVGARLRPDQIGDAMRVAKGLAARGEAPDPERLRSLVAWAVERVGERLALTRDAAAIATSTGAHDPALEAVRRGVLGGLDPTELAADPGADALVARDSCAVQGSVSSGSRPMLRSFAARARRLSFAKSDT
ncbi:MAG: hypothetical protein OHK0013_29120 [Sandaracinaceae bacterium]